MKSNFDVIAGANDKEGNYNAPFVKPPWFDQKLFNDGREFYFKYKKGIIWTPFLGCQNACKDNQST